MRKAGAQKQHVLFVKRRTTLSFHCIGKSSRSRSRSRSFNNRISHTLKTVSRVASFSIFNPQSDKQQLVLRLSRHKWSTLDQNLHRLLCTHNVFVDLKNTKHLDLEYISFFTSKCGMSAPSLCNSFFHTITIRKILPTPLNSGGSPAPAWPPGATSSAAAPWSCSLATSAGSHTSPR